MAKFRPSIESLSPVQKAETILAYIQAATELIQDHVAETGEVPPLWVMDAIQRSAASMGMAVSYLRNTKKESK